MTQPLEFALVVVAVSVSGVMAPGPLFAANISHGLRGGAGAGLRMAAGHAVVELPLIVLLGMGVLSLQSFPGFRGAISVAGAAALFAFAALQIRSALRGEQGGGTAGPRHGPLITGIVLSALNPFFVIWWMTVGLKLVSDAMLAWAFWGMLAVFAFHIWMDFVWLGGTAWLASKSMRVLSGRTHKILMLGLGGVLIYFGAVFLADAGF